MGESTTVENTANKFKAVLDEKRNVSTKISDLCRYIGFGVAAATYSILTSSSAYAIFMFNNYKHNLLIAALLACVTIILDYLQYIFGYQSATDALNNKEHDYKYDSKTCCYQAREFCFYAKQFTTILSSSMLIYTIIKSLQK